MQYSQPQLGPYDPYLNQHYQHFNSFGQVPPQFQRNYNIMDSTIGEGEVVTVYNPDGSRQFYFIPRLLYAQLQNRRTCICNVYPCPCTPWPYPGQCGQNSPWLITSISDPVASPMPACYNRMWNNARSNQQQLSFHRDADTSTTDLHYYFAQLRQLPWLNKPSASVQATPTDEPMLPSCSCNNREAIEAKTRAKNSVQFANQSPFLGIPMYI